MALTNCKKISDFSITVTKDQALGGSTDATMYIEPINSNYVLAASNFQNNTSSSSVSSYINTLNNSNNYVNGIKLSDTTTAYAANNTIRVDIDLLDTFSPSANTEFEIDIDGSATHLNDIIYSVSGLRRIVSTSSGLDGHGNITPTSSSQTAYSFSGKQGEVVSVYSATFTATGSFYFTSTPELQFENQYDAGVNIEEYKDNYKTVITNKTYDNNDRLTSFDLSLEYTFPSKSFSGHEVAYVVNFLEEAADEKLITGYNMDTSVIPPQGAYRNISIYGTPGASFVFTLTDTTSSPNTTYDFSYSNNNPVASFTATSTNLSGTIPDSGEYIFESIKFPKTTLQNFYSASLQGGTSPATNTELNNITDNTAYTWGLKSTELINIEILAERGSNYSSFVNEPTYLNNSLLVEKGKKLLNDAGNPIEQSDFTITVTGTKNLFLRREIVFSSVNAFDTTGLNDFSNTLEKENGGSVFSIDGLETTGDGTQTLTIEGSLGVTQSGHESIESVISLDNVINRAPSVSATQTFTSKQGTAELITLSGSDDDGDALTFKITQDATNGELYEESDVEFTTPITGFPYSLTYGNKNKVWFKHDNSSNLTTTFKYKSNDGFEDSATECTVSGTLAAVNTLPVATAQSNLPVDQGHTTFITLSGTDAENNNLTFIITALPSDGDLYISHPEGTAGNNYLTSPGQAHSFYGYYGNLRIKSTDLPKTVSSSNVVVYRHNNDNTNNTDSFQFKANDGKDDSASAASISFDINRRPSSTTQDITVEGLGEQNITLTGTDLDGDTIGFILKRLPSHGALYDGASTYPITQAQVDGDYEIQSNYLRYKNFVQESSDYIQIIPTNSGGLRGQTDTVNITINVFIPEGQAGFYASNVNNPAVVKARTSFLANAYRQAATGNNRIGSAPAICRLEVTGGGASIIMKTWFNITSNTYGYTHNYYQRGTEDSYFTLAIANVYGSLAHAQAYVNLGTNNYFDTTNILTNANGDLLRIIKAPYEPAERVGNKSKAWQGVNYVRSSYEPSGSNFENPPSYFNDFYHNDTYGRAHIIDNDIFQPQILNLENGTYYIVFRYDIFTQAVTPILHQAGLFDALHDDGRFL